MVRFGTEQSKKCTHVWLYISAIKAGEGAVSENLRELSLKLLLPRIHLMDNLVHSCKTNRNDSLTVQGEDEEKVDYTRAGMNSCRRRLLKNFSHSNILTKEDHEYDGS